MNKTHILRTQTLKENILNTVAHGYKKDIIQINGSCKLLL